MTRELDNDGRAETPADGIELKILNDDQRRSAEFLRDSSAKHRVETEQTSTE